MNDLAEGDRAWSIPWPCCYEFLSVVTNRRIWKDSATTPEQAWLQFHAWYASPSNRMIGETRDFAGILQRFVQRPHVVEGDPADGHQRPHVVGGVVHDARIAAICVAHGVDTLFTRDRDFSLFPELPTRNPLSAP